ncbi:MAG: glycosyltransferase [Patescibacteria group bacterium]
MNEFLPRYNKSTSLILVTSYPRRTDRSVESLNAVASYADHLVPHLASNLKKTGSDLIILAEKLKGEEEVYVENDVLVIRCWERNNPAMFFSLRRVFKKLDKVKKVLYQFEFNMMGGSLITLLFPAFLFYIRFRRKKETILLHQVVLDIGELGGHIGLKKGSPKSLFLNFGMNIFYRLVLSAAHHVVVHEEILRKRLSKVSRKEIHVVSHGLGEYSGLVSESFARERLGIAQDEFVVLCFGFITWYKGSDWVVEAFANFFRSNPEAKIKLVMAGGESANLKSHSYYHKYYEKVTEMAAQSEKIVLTGFVPDEMVPYYFAASNVVLLPYRYQMSASGPLALALNFSKPFLLSTMLKETLENPDMKESLAEIDIQNSELLFDLDVQDLYRKITRLIENEELLEKMSLFADHVRKKRHWSITSQKFIDIIYEEK